MAGKTLSEKIIAEHCGRDVRAGEVVVVDVDLSYVQDGTGPLTVRRMIEMGLERAYAPEKTIFFLDHASPSPRMELSNDHEFLREFARKTGILLSDVGNGISHHNVLEKYACPGDIIVGADSHTCTGGALGAFATGMGSTDVAAAIALGKTWMKVPETYLVEVNGKLPKGVFSKDIILHLIGEITSNGATYKALEFTGDTIAGLSTAARSTIANMAVEAGAKAGLFPPDSETRNFLREMGREEKFRELKSDEDADFERKIEINAEELEPVIACPHLVDNTKPISQLKGVKVNEVFIGTSCNGRLEDLHIAASILKGEKIHPNTRVVVTPASRRVYLEALHDGTIEIFVEAGAVVTSPGCGACDGVHLGILGDGDVCLATQPRNFKGRMGSPNAFIYLGSPAVAAATALKGEIADPREVM
ncbi:MAG: 3-isopropylmalate dehydratase large subunit [Candidatus Methanoperedens sp.]|nr:3-isopropylmalate dehydratase large subunit [Candidatus Methanoperedens sp.]